MIIGAAGVTLQKIRKHTGASIEVMQETANDGFSVAHVSGSLEQVYDRSEATAPYQAAMRIIPSCRRSRCWILFFFLEETKSSIYIPCTNIKTHRSTKPWM